MTKAFWFGCLLLPVLLTSCTAREQHDRAESQSERIRNKGGISLSDDKGEWVKLGLYNIQATTKPLIVADVIAYESGRVLLRAAPNSAHEFLCAQLTPQDVEECARHIAHLGHSPRASTDTRSTDSRELFVCHLGARTVLTPGTVPEGQWNQAVERVARLVAKAWEKKDERRVRVEFHKE